MLTNRNINTVYLLLALAVVLLDVFQQVSVGVYVSIALSYIGFQTYGSIVLSAQYFIPVKSRAKEPVNAIALTFDDGPIPGNTERILDILKANGIPGAFFLIGNRVKENPALTKRIREEGHLLGNHSFWHGKLFDLQPAGKIETELRETDRIIEAAAGVRPRFFRPPYGVTNPMVASAIRGGQYVTVGWSVRSFDTNLKDKNKLFNRVTSRLKKGDVLLFHDYSESTIEMLPALLEHVARIGLKIVRVDELINEKAYV